MISKNSINNIVHKLHLDEFIESHKRLLRDNRGGFLIPFEVKITDKEYERYRHLPIDWSLSSITKDDLPVEFSDKSVKTVDMFRRKTYGLDIECMIYFDIETGNIVSCNFADDDPGHVNGTIYPNFLKGMHIASAHNHPRKYGSPPSGKNFEMLQYDFEEFEIILSQRELWVLESKIDVFDEARVNKIRKALDEGLQAIFDEINDDYLDGYLVLDNLEREYGNFLLIYLNKGFDNIKLTRRYLDG
ncbi:MAG: hypothetical protein E7Z83_01620 [Methanobrevibacter sp.]|nr:hypothetical protein [Methanobrevibacter sp.]MBE6489541.1 hypothetical protein [Methanobrevibacter sp.]